jgi:hypothetical protein
MRSARRLELVEELAVEHPARLAVVERLVADQDVVVGQGRERQSQQDPGHEAAAEEQELAAPHLPSRELGQRSLSAGQHRPVVTGVAATRWRCSQSAW